MGNKNRKFWEGLKKWEMIVLIETWVRNGGGGGEMGYQKDIGGRYNMQREGIGSEAQWEG